VFSRVISRLERDYVNRVMSRFVGIGPRIQIENVGRRSGVVRRTPVLGFRDGDVYRVGINHEDAQWCKNVMSVGSCKVVLRDRVLDVQEPRLRPAEDCLDLLPNPIAGCSATSFTPPRSSSCPPGEVPYVHGSTGAREMHPARGDGLEVCVTVTLLDALVLARSAFHHSLNYRSVVVPGAAVVAENQEEKTTALAALVEAVAPGRTGCTRPPSRTELAATTVLRLDLHEVSV